MRSAYIVSAVRTPTGRGKKGSLRQTRPEDLGRIVVREAVRRVPELDPEEIDDLVIGCAMPEGPQGLNISRTIGLYAGLPVRVPGVTVNRFCSSGLQTIAQAAASILAGWTEIAVAGGVECMSLVPMTGVRFSGHPQLAVEWPEIYISMGITAENVAKKYDVSREEQDRFALASQRKAARAWETRRFDDEIVPVPFELRDETTGELSTGTLEKDELVRPHTTLEGLARLRPVFAAKGTVTAGNASPLTDGAAAVVVMSEEALKRTGATPIARFLNFQVEGVPPEIMGIGPVEVIPKVCARAGIPQSEVGLLEINEAFASQAAYSVRALGLDPDTVNVNGGAIAIGHPLGATGSKLTATLLHEMRRRGTRYGIVSMCIGGGQGAAGLFELV